jgi:hypothetical protein
MSGYRSTDVDAGSPISDELALSKTDFTPDDLVRHVWGRKEASYNDRIDLQQREWPLNYEFVHESRQWLWWNEALEELLPRPVNAGQKYTENHMVGLVAHAAAGIVQNPPAYDTVALNRDYESQLAARDAKQLLMVYAKNLDLARLAHRSALDCLVFGMGIEKTFWDPCAGTIEYEYAPRYKKRKDEKEKKEDKKERESKEPEIYEERIDPDAVLDAKPTWYDKLPRHKGEMRVVRMLPWCIFPQVGLTEPSFQNADYVIEESWQSEASVRRRWNIKDDEEFDPGPAEGYGVVMPGGRLPTQYSGAFPDGRLLVLTYYQKPAPYPGWERGVQIHICGTRLLGIAPLQSSRGRLPFQLYPGLPRPGKFWPRPWASDLREPQMRINSALSHSLTWAAILCGPNLVAEKGSGLPEDIAMGFHKMEHAPGSAPPHWLVPPPAPPELFGLKAQAEQGMSRVAMVFPESYGQHQKNIPAAEYAAMLKDSDAVDQQPIVRDHASARQEQGELLLDLAKQFENEGTMVAMMGESKRSHVFEFKKDKLQIDAFRVFVQPTSMLQYLSSARVQNVLGLLQQGMFGPPQNMTEKMRAQLLRWINFPNLTEVEGEFSKERRRAELNQDRIIFDQKPVKVDPRWDPAPLLEELSLRILDDDFELWPKKVVALMDDYFQQLNASLEKRTQSMEQEQDKQLQKGIAVQKQDYENKQEAAAKKSVTEKAADVLLNRPGSDPGALAAMAGVQPGGEQAPVEPEQGAVQ